MTGVTKVKCYVLKILASISLLESITWIPIEILYVHGHLRITQWYGYVACVQTPTISPGVGDDGTQGKFGQKRCAAEIFKPRLFLRQKSLTSLDLNQLIGCLQTSTRCFKRQKISSPHVESCLFTITDFVAEARKQNHILQDFWTAAYWTRLSKISWFVSCKAKNSSARHWQITIFCDNRVQ